MKPSLRIAQIEEETLKKRNLKGRPITSMDKAKIATEAIKQFLDEQYHQ